MPSICEHSPKSLLQQYRKHGGRTPCIIRWSELVSSDCPWWLQGTTHLMKDPNARQHLDYGNPSPLLRGYSKYTLTHTCTNALYTLPECPEWCLIFQSGATSLNPCPTSQNFWRAFQKYPIMNWCFRAAANWCNCTNILRIQSAPMKCLLRAHWESHH